VRNRQGANVTKPLEGWDEEQRARIQRDVFATGLSRHLPHAGAVLLAAVVSFPEPPTLDELGKVLRRPSDPTGSWDGPAWEEPKPFTPEELADLRAEFPHADEEPEDADTVNAQEVARFQEHRARVDRYAAHYGLPPIRTCRDLLRLLLAAGILHQVVEAGASRFRPAWPLPVAEDVFPIAAEERVREDELRWRDLHEGSAQRIIGLFRPDSGEAGDSLTSSLERLGRRLDLEPESIRQGILNLVGAGDFSVNVDIARVPPHKVFTLRVD
jgi:hypothetical protein